MHFTCANFLPKYTYYTVDGTNRTVVVIRRHRGFITYARTYSNIMDKMGHVEINPIGRDKSQE